MIAAFRKKNLLIVAVNVNPAAATWKKSRKEAKAFSFPDNNDWYKISDKINIITEDIYLTKHTWNAFFDTALNNELKKRAITAIVLAAIFTSIGVEGTGRAASELAYNITFAIDAMTDMQEEAHHRSIKYIFHQKGETGSTDEIVDILSQL